MKIINPEVHLLDSVNVNPYQFIEKIGRTCYKSIDKITEDSAESFVRGLCKRKHYAMLEHYWVHIITDISVEEIEEAVKYFALCLFGSKESFVDLIRYVHVTNGEGINTYISAPLRVFIELEGKLKELRENYIGFQYEFFNPYKLMKAFMYCIANEFSAVFDTSLYSNNEYTSRIKIVTDQKKYIDNIKKDMCNVATPIVDREIKKHRTHTALFVCDRGVSHELVRHRPCSFAQESTRYCNYSKDKFDNQITVVKPFFFNRFTDTAKNVLYDDSAYSDWLMACEYAEKMYFRLINKGATPQEARSVLPNSLKTELIMTTNEKEWQHIIDLRYVGVTGSPHPQMKEVMGLAVPQLIYASQGRLKVGE